MSTVLNSPQLTTAQQSRPRGPAHRYAYHVEQPVTDGRVAAFLRTFEAVLEHTNYGPVLDTYARGTTRCTRCACTCQIYQVTHDPHDIPCYRSELLLRIYRTYFTFGGWLRSQMGGNGPLTESHIDELAESVYRCTACRRCSLECPMGIDHGLLTHLARYILSEIGVVPKALQVSVREQLHGKTHNTSAVPVPGLLDNLEFLEEEIEEMKGVRIKFPVDVPDVDYVFFPAVSDYLMEADTLMGNAAVLNAAGDGENWTIGTQYFDGINYGLFYSDRVLEHIIRRLVAEVTRLRAKVILVGECGHASRSAKSYVPQFADGKYPVMSFLEYTALAIGDGRIELDPHAVTERVTYHDPCNIARSGWLVDQPRQILKAFVRDFVEMTPRGRDNYCCGGGGGTVSMDETHEYRMTIAGKVKADQIRRTGAQIVATPCANCKKQLRELVEYYELPVQVVGIHDLVLRAIRLHPNGNASGNGNGRGHTTLTAAPSSGTGAVS